MDRVGQDALDIKYRFGYSIKNPKLVKSPYVVKKDPWFKMKWAPYGPSEVKQDIWNRGKLPTYPSVWRRAGKSVNLERLGLSGVGEIVSYNELGQVPGPTDRPGVTQGRNVWGLLESVATKVGDIIMSREQTKLMQAQAELQVRSQSFFSPTFGQDTSSYWPWVLGIGALGVGVYMFSRR